MRILIADDEKNFTELLSLMVRKAGHEVAHVVNSGGLATIRAYNECAPDVVLLDYMMPNYNGVTAARQIISKDPGARCGRTPGTVGRSVRSHPTRSG